MPPLHPVFACPPPRPAPPKPTLQEIRKTMAATENAHLQEMEALTNEEDRKIEQLQFHRAMVRD